MKIWNIMLAGSVCSLAKSSWKYWIWSYFCSLISIRVYWLFITMIVHELVFWFNSCLYHKVTLLLLLFCIVQECSQGIHTVCSKGKASWKVGYLFPLKLFLQRKLRQTISQAPGSMLWDRSSGNFGRFQKNITQGKFRQKPGVGTTLQVTHDMNQLLFTTLSFVSFQRSNLILYGILSMIEEITHKY